MKTVLAVVAFAAVALGIAAIVVARRAARAAESDAEEASSAAALAAARVAAVAALSFPVLWLAMGAEAAEWPGIVCANGVLRLGTDAGGVAAALPWALGAAVLAKTLAAGATGAWIVLRRVGAAHAAPAVARRSAAWMLAAGAFAVADGGATVAWASIPRDAPRVYSGCCTSEIASAASAPSRTTDAGRSAWTVAFLGSGAGTTILLGVGSRSAALRAPGSPWWAAHGAASVATAATGAAFASAALAPARLGLPLHECAFCLLDRAPENWIGAAALAAAPACTAWAWLAARTPAPGGDGATARLLGAGSVASAAAVALGASGRWLS